MLARIDLSWPLAWNYGRKCVPLDMRACGERLFAGVPRAATRGVESGRGRLVFLATAPLINQLVCLCEDRVQATSLYNAINNPVADTTHHIGEKQDQEWGGEVGQEMAMGHATLYTGVQHQDQKASFGNHVNVTRDQRAYHVLDHSVRSIQLGVRSGMRPLYYY